MSVSTFASEGAKPVRPNDRVTMRGGDRNLLMISGDATIAEGRQGAFYQMLQRFAPAWARVDIIVPRPTVVAATTLFENVFIHPSSTHKAFQWRHILQQGLSLNTERRYDLMTSHDYGWHYNGLGTWLLHRRIGTPYVSEIHHVTGYPRSATIKEWIQGCLTRCYIRAISDQVAAFRVPNALELPNLLRSLRVPPEKILVLSSLYIDRNIFTPRPVAKQYDVVFCGRADSNKGVGILFQAVAAVARTRPSLTVLMRTSGHQEASWRRLAERLGIAARITWRNWVDTPAELASLYCASRMLVCTSYSEGGPRVTVEAMACGIPVISTPVGVMPELIEHGRTGLLVDWSPKSVAVAIDRLLSDPDTAEAIGVGGCQRVTGFDREVVVDQYAAAYRKLADASIAEAIRR